MLLFNCDLDVDYHLTIRTGDLAGAGTDAPVFIQIVGDDGETERIELSPGGTGDKRFDKGRTDKFVIGTLDVGKVCELTLQLEESREGGRKGGRKEGWRKGG